MIASVIQVRGTLEGVASLFHVNSGAWTQSSGVVASAFTRWATLLPLIFHSFVFLEQKNLQYSIIQEFFLFFLNK